MRLLLSLVGLPLLIGMHVDALAGDGCKGTPTEHRKGAGYEFVTTSQVYADGDVHIYETCVENRGTLPLDFRWYVPGPHSWVLAETALSNQRPRVAPETLNGQPGCLRYDNLWTPYQAEFLPHADDRAALDEEARMGCAARIGEPTGSKGHSEGSFVDRIFDVSSRLEVYAPTDPRRPIETMIHVEAFVDIKPTEGGASFTHILSYSASPAYPESFVASYDEILIIPEAEDIRLRYSDQYSEGILVLSQEDAAIMQLDAPEQPRLGEIQYRLVTRNREHVATLFVPYWLETE